MEKSVPRITAWHHEACRVMTSSDHEGQIFLSYPHMNNGFFFLLTIEYHILCLKMLPEVPDYAEMPYDWMMSLEHNKTSLDNHMGEFQYNQCTVLT